MNKDEKEKVVREYKGDIVAVSTLTGEVGIACEVPETAIPAQATKFGNVPAAKLPRLIIVTNVGPSPYGPESRYLTYSAYASKWRAGGTYVPADFKLKRLTGRQGREMGDKYAGYALDSKLSGSLQHGWSTGCDPEIFVTDENAKVIPAFSFLGSKKEPNRTSEGCGAYWDGYQAEFETKATTCLAYLADSVQYGLKAVQENARKKNPKARLSSKTVMEIPFEMLQADAEEHVSLGCAPSLNVYGLSGKQVAARELPFRSAGGHIHFGIGEKKQETINEIVKALDAILGVACVSLFANFDNPARREFYGLPGEYRLPKHGLEYRTLSNAWMFHPTIMHMVFDLSRKVVMFGQNGFRRFWKGDEQETIDIIRSCDVPKARQVLERNKEVILKLFKAVYFGDVEPAYNIFMNGMETAIKDPTDICGNWNLDGAWTAHSDGYEKNWAKSVEAFKAGKKI